MMENEDQKKFFEGDQSHWCCQVFFFFKELFSWLFFVSLMTCVGFAKHSQNLDDKVVNLINFLKQKNLKIEASTLFIVIENIKRFWILYWSNKFANVSKSSWFFFTIDKFAIK